MYAIFKYGCLCGLYQQPMSKMNLFLPFGQQSHLQGYFAAWETFFLHGETLISQALPLHGH